MIIPFEKDKLKLWSAVCIISAIPSFYWALDSTKANVPAMFIGIVLFILGYTAITSSDFYKQQKQKIFWFSALKWAFRVRVIYSLLAIAVIIFYSLNTQNAKGAFWVSIVDGYLGVASIGIAELLIGNKGFITFRTYEDHMLTALDNTFFVTLFVTITQGILLSLLVLLVAVIIWCFLRVKNIVSHNKMVKT